MRLMTVVGARPQFIKAAAVSRAVETYNQTVEAASRIEELIVHTGQHYDGDMSDAFFAELDIPHPIANLGVGSASHAKQTGEMLVGLEGLMLEKQPDWVLVYGDTNSTLAATLVAAKLHIPVAHVEAGVRSFNRRMPEEINRVVTDRVASLLLCPIASAVDQLAREGVRDGVHFVGDVMYDAVLYNLGLAQDRSDVLARFGLGPKAFYVATVHRPANTDDVSRLEAILGSLDRLRHPVLLPAHPRTRNVMRQHGLAWEDYPSIRAVDPVGYLDMLMLQANARIVLTDSGGMQKEALFVGTPCITLRDETEWNETLDAGANRLVGADPNAIHEAVEHFEREPFDAADAARDMFGDGHAAEQIVAILLGL